MQAVLFDGMADPRVVAIERPVGSDGLTTVKVLAAPLTNLDVAVARGRHYFSPKELPAVVGREAIVIDPSGKRMFLNALAMPAPFGSMAEWTAADLAYALPVPDGLSDETAAAIGNAGLAAWLPLSWRARLEPGETVLIVGATGVTGRIAVRAAKLLGAGRVIAVGRNPDVLAQLLEHGADAIVRLGEGDLVAALRHVAEGGVDVVLDYLNGAPADAALRVMATHGRMVQIGSLLAPAISLDAQIARRASLDVLGFAYYHAPIELQADAYRSLCLAAAEGSVRSLDNRPAARRIR